MAVSDKNTRTDFGLPDLTSLSESERLQVLAVMQKAQVNMLKLIFEL